MLRVDANKFIEALVPPMMSLMAMEKIKSEGAFELREDTYIALRQSIGVILKHAPADKIEKIVTTSFNVAEGLLGPEHVGSFRQLLLASCMFSAKLVDEGLDIDPGSQAVLVGLSILTEAKEDTTGEWGYSLKRLEDAGGRMVSRARLLGYYLNKK